ncbi:MAG: acyltransferase family protein [Janthinobacterium lividum]
MVQSPAFLPKTILNETRSRPTGGHKDYLDGIRALAALWVVLSHLWIIPCGLAARDTWLGRLTNWTLYSHFAVDIFIVLSGFCLILPVARDGELQGGVLRFFLRRAQRILPPFYAALAISIGIMLAVQALGHHALHINRVALAANVFLVQDVFQPLDIFNGPFWSIAVEWRIYFLFPVLVWVLPRYGKRGVLLLAGLAGGVATLMILRVHPEMVLACPWYLLLFALGLCSGSLSMGKNRRGDRQRCFAVCLVSLAGLAALIDAHPVTTHGSRNFGSYLPLTDTVAGLAVAAGLLSVSWSPQNFPLLSWPPLVTLGTFAYSLYLIHMPCLLLFSKLLTVYLPAWHHPLQRFSALALTLPLVITLAWLFFLVFEKPFIRQRRKELSGGQQTQQRA